MKLLLLTISILCLCSTSVQAGGRPHGPRATYAVEYDLAASMSTQFTVAHQRGYIPQVVIVSGDSRVLSNIFYLDDTEVTFTLDNVYRPPSSVIHSTATILIW